MSLHPIIASLDKAAGAVPLPEGPGCGPSIELRDRRGDSLSDFMRLFFPAGTPQDYVSVVAGAINAALDAAPATPYEPSPEDPF